MYRDRHYMLIILVGSLAYGLFLLWMALNHIWAFIAIVVITICGVAYAMKNAELVAPDDNRYEKIIVCYYEK